MPGDGTKYGKLLQMYIMTIYLGNRGQFTKFGYEKCYPGILPPRTSDVIISDVKTAEPRTSNRKIFLFLPTSIVHIIDSLVHYGLTNIVKYTVKTL